MARVEAGALRLNIEAVDLTDAAASAVHDARATLANHKVTLAVPPDLPLVLADAQLLHHVILNLLDNAGRYCPAATGITIAATRTPDGIDLSVLDEGPGLPPGSEASIFETFDRGEGSDRKGGTGLGLAIVKGFAGAMGVSVSAANRETDGAAFALHFPEPLVVRPRAAA
jgi:two-component system sensor histidine kinase KdpD